MFPSSKPRRFLAAGAATLCAGTALLAGAAGAAGAVGASPRSSFTKTLTDIVASGTLASTKWTVPSGDAFQLTDATLHSTGAGTSGEVRVELLGAASNPENLLVTSLTQIGTAFHASLASPLVFQAGQSVDVTVACESDQAACGVTLSLSGQLVPSSTHNAAYFSNLEDVVAPGTSASSSWTVPANDTLGLTDLLASTDPSSQRGEVTLVVTPAGGKPRTLLHKTLATLGVRPLDHVLEPPVFAGAGAKVTLTLTCGADQSACDTAVVFAGQLS